ELRRERDAAKQAQGEAEARGREAREQRDQAHASIRDAFEAMDLMLRRAAVGKLTRPLPPAEARNQQLNDALALYQRFLQYRGDAPEVRRIIAQAHVRCASLCQELGRSRDADSHYRQALAVLTDLERQFPERAEFRDDQAIAHNNLAVLRQ